MNKKGQTLIAFVILLPVLLLLLAFVVDTGLLLQENTKLTNTTKTILKTMYDKKGEVHFEKDIKNLYQKNNIPTENIKLTVHAQEVIVENQYSIESIFGKIIGIKNYPLKIKMRAFKNTDKIIISKE